MTITIGENVNTVWNNVLKWTTEISGDWVSSSPSIIVRATRLLLSLTIALAVTMILYNWMTYIIQVWRWKDSQDLVKNVVYIVVWILISLFSVIIITLLQSVPKTLDNELHSEKIDDEEVLVGKTFTWKETREKVKELFKGKEKYTITIKYVYSRGWYATRSHTEDLSNWEVYAVESPSITYYEADQTKVSGIVSWDVEITVTYSPINDENRNGIADEEDSNREKSKEMSDDLKKALTEEAIKYFDKNDIFTWSDGNLKVRIDGREVDLIQGFRETIGY